MPYLSRMKKMDRGMMAERPITNINNEDDTYTMTIDRNTMTRHINVNSSGAAPGPVLGYFLPIYPYRLYTTVQVCILAGPRPRPGI